VGNSLESFRTSREDFKLFKRTFMEWVAKFGMNDWEIQFYWEDNDIPGSMCGGIARNAPGRNASVYLGKTWGMPVTKNDLLRTAVHEFAHLLIADMEHLAGQRNASEAEIDLAREIMARRFENWAYPVKH
jgi:hypothetical protein